MTGGWVVVVVYGIAKDEEKHAERFARSVRDADAVIICDTGSTDRTPEILRDFGIAVHRISVSPWRFDLARNMALRHVPENASICVSLDLDEVLLPGWRDVIEDSWLPGTTMLRYPYVHSWEDANCTIPRVSIWGFKIHARNAYVWKYPIHEILEPICEEKVAVTDREIIRHYPDLDKAERYSRIELLEQAVKEYPTDQRMSYLYGRELFFHGRYQEAIKELKRHLSITEPYKDFDPEGIAETRSMSMRLIARCLMALRGDPNEIMVWLIRAVAESPSQREPWIWLAQGWYTVGDYAAAYACAMRGLAITDRLRSIEIEEFCWGDYPKHLAERAFEMMMAQRLGGVR